MSPRVEHTAVDPGPMAPHSHVTADGTLISHVHQAATVSTDPNDVHHTHDTHDTTTRMTPVSTRTRIEVGRGSTAG